MALDSPSHGRPRTDIDESLPTDVRHGHAFCQLIEAIPAKSLPKAGGCGATIVVTMTLDQLLADLHSRRGVRPGHRWADHRRPGTTTRLHRRDHPRRPRRPLPGPRPRPQTQAPHRSPTHRHGHPRPWLHRPRMRPTTRAVPRPPRPPLVPGRQHRPHTGRLLCGHHHRRIHDPRYAADRLTQRQSQPSTGGRKPVVSTSARWRSLLDHRRPTARRPTPNQPQRSSGTAVRRPKAPGTPPQPRADGNHINRKLNPRRPDPVVSTSSTGMSPDRWARHRVWSRLSARCAGNAASTTGQYYLMWRR